MTIKIDKTIVGYSVKGETQNEDDSLEDDLLYEHEDIPDCEDCDYKTIAATGYGQNIKRPEVLPAAVYKISDPIKYTNIYCSISNMGGRPFEVFINSRHTESQQYVSAMTVLISLALRAGIPADFIGRELAQIVDSNPYFHKGKSGCTVSHIGRTILQHCRDEESDLTALVEKTGSIVSDAESIDSKPVTKSHGECPKCGEDMQLMDGCPTCLSCGHSKCG